MKKSVLALAFLGTGGALAAAATGRGEMPRPERPSRIVHLLASHGRRAPGARSPNADCPLGKEALDPTRRLREIGSLVRGFAPSHPGRSYERGPGSLPLPERPSFIDEEIFGALDAAGVRPAPLSLDSEFLRRVTLDLTGRIPDPETAARFLADASPLKRPRKIDELLASDAFNDRWALFLDDLFRVTAYSTSSFLQFPGRDAWHRFFLDAVRRGVPYDEIARQVLTGRGSSFVSGPANFTVRDLADGPPQDTFDNLAATTGRVFLGTNTFCISCHGGAGHTNQLNLWLTGKRRSDFWGTAAFFARTGLAVDFLPASKEYVFTVSEGDAGEYRLDTTDGNKTPRQPGVDGAAVVPPSFILGGEGPRPGEDYRQALGRILTSQRQFSRAAVNYVWRELFSLGIVEPANGFDLARLDPEAPPPAPWKLQPTHPALLERLAEFFEANDYDLRALVRVLARSNAYQLSSFYPGEWNDGYVPLFARHYPRRLRAEELADALSVATAFPLPLRVNGWADPVFWAGQLPDTVEPLGDDPTGVSYVVFGLLDAFGRGDRDTRPRSEEGSILQALHLLDNPLVTVRVRPDLPGTRVSRLLGSGSSDAQIVDALYLATLSRSPSDDERRTALGILQDGKRTRGDALADLHFALLNKLDFLFNY